MTLEEFKSRLRLDRCSNLVITESYGASALERCMVELLTTDHVIIRLIGRGW